jgi:hypothetical protein
MIIYSRSTRVISRGSRNRFAVLLALLVLVAANTRAQGESSISGVVADASGRPIPGATLKVENLETGASRNLITDSAGRYDVPLLPVGKYKVTAEMSGFQGELRSPITLAVGDTAPRQSSCFSESINLWTWPARP